MTDPLPADPVRSPATPASSAPAARSRSAQVALGVFLGLMLGLLLFRGYGGRVGARPSTPVAPAPLELNRAAVDELVQLPGVGPVLARHIIEYREQQGGFRSVEELRAVPGIGPVTLERLRAFVRVDPVAGPGLLGADPVEPLVLERKSGSRPAIAAPATPDLPPVARPAAVRKLQPGDPPLNVNTAPVEDLQRLPGVGPVLARNIAAARAERPFRSLADLDRVKGIGPKTLEKIRPFVTWE